MNILLVDDNSKIRSYVKKLLIRKLKNLENIYECADGKTAIDLYQSSHPDWVVMDIMLPEMDGLEATRLILEKDPKAKIIILTQYNDVVYREAAKNIGAFDFLSKENLDIVLQVIEFQRN